MLPIDGQSMAHRGTHWSDRIVRHNHRPHSLNKMI
jgi:hypothetical protein